MKAVILCGGKGTRLSEETTLRPKPMVEIGGRPILWHIMNMYSSFNVNDFVLALGYKGDFIKDYFQKFYTLNSDFKIQLGTGEIKTLSESKRDWSVALIDTGIDSMTGGRLLRLRNELHKETYFMATYGDGVSDVNIGHLLDFHKSHGRIATVTAVRPPVRFGEMTIDGDQVSIFAEKPQSSVGWINGGFFIFSPKIFEYIKDETTVLEREPLEALAKQGQLMAYKHEGFWQCMDTLRDKEHLNTLWDSGNVPWDHGRTSHK